MAVSRLSDADRQRARELAEAAPPLTPEQRERIRTILAGCTPAAASPRAVITPCAHCGQVCGDYAGGWSSVTRPDGSMAPLCHPNDPGRPDCYRRVTVYHEPLGALTGVRPLPEGISDVR